MLLADKCIGVHMSALMEKLNIIVTFNALKVSQSRAVIDRFCQDEGFELTYYIETLCVPR